jgi:hypothetical protein
MGRGMSDLQKTILRRALSNKIRENRNDEKGADVYGAEIAADHFGWTLPPYFYREDLQRCVGRRVFSKQEIGEQRYSSVRAAICRAILRLEERGLGYKRRGACSQWTGFTLTEEGVQAAEKLSVKLLELMPMG